MTRSGSRSDLERAYNFLQEGDAVECEKICQAIVKTQTQDSSVNHILALAQRAQGKHSCAEKVLADTLSFDANNLAVMNSYGLVLMEQGKLAAASQIFHQALALNSGYAIAYANLGHIEAMQGRVGEAEQNYRKALANDPKLVDAYVQLGLVLRQQGRLSELDQQYGIPEEDEIKDPGLLLIRGLAAIDGDSFAQAEMLFRKGVRILPNSATLWSNLGLSLSKQDKTKEARVAFAKAVEIEPQNAAAQINLADLLKYDDTESARRHLIAALEIEPKNVNAIDILGFTWFLDGAVRTAEEFYNRALDIDPTFERAAFHLSGVHFIEGRLADAWPLYAKKYFTAGELQSPVDDSIPLWNTRGDIDAGTLIWTDQGIGDEILQLGLVADIYRQGSTFTLITGQKLAPIVRRSFPGLEHHTREELKQDRSKASQSFKSQTPAILLAKRLRRSFEDFPFRHSYLKANPEQTCELRRKYLAQNDGRPLIGLSWKSPNSESGSYKSISLDQLKPIFEETSYTFLVLQYGEIAKELEELPAKIRDRFIVDANIDPTKDLDGFASQVAAVDAVLTTSNTTAHVAGSLGIPSWTLVPKVGPGWLWYWFTNHTKSLWYPQMRLHRQSQDKTWTDAIAQAFEEIRQHLERDLSVTTN